MLSHRQVLEVLARHRSDSVVITTMGSVGIWPELSDTPLDFAYIPSSMGQGIALGLGIATAQPNRRVIVTMGDGSMLMNLGSLVTLANHPASIYVLLIDNGLYEVTGGQPVAGAGRTDFGLLAKSVGIERVYCISELADWQQQISQILTGPGPVFVWLKVQGQLGQKTPSAPRSMREQKQRLQEALGVSETRSG